MQLCNLQSALSPDVAGTFFVKEIQFMTDQSLAAPLREKKWGGKKKEKKVELILVVVSLPFWGSLITREFHKA